MYKVFLIKCLKKRISTVTVLQHVISVSVLLFLCCTTDLLHSLLRHKMLSQYLLRWNDGSFRISYYYFSIKQHL